MPPTLSKYARRTHETHQLGSSGIRVRLLGLIRFWLSLTIVGSTQLQALTCQETLSLSGINQIPKAWRFVGRGKSEALLFSWT